MFESMLLGAASRLFVEQVFTADAVWTAPEGVDVLAGLEMTGGVGSDTTSWGGPFPILELAAIQSSVGVSTSISAMNSHAESEFSKFSSLNSAGQSISWDRRSINGFGSSANTIVISDRLHKFYRADPDYTPGVKKSGGSGQEVNGWGQSGTWNPGDPTLVWKVSGVQQRTGSFIIGDDTKGFGFTANGGSGEPGETIEFQDVSVVSGQSYPLIVPAGGQIKIGYFV